MCYCLPTATVILGALWETQKILYMSFAIQIVDRGLKTSLVLEDDLRFEIFFKRRLQNLLSELESQSLDWDLM